MRYQIGDFSKITSMSIKTLRYYHEEGLLTPDYIDPDSGYRFYSESLLEKANLIRELKALEFPLKTIKEIVEQPRDEADIIDYIKAQSIEIERQIVHYQTIQQRLHTAMTQGELFSLTSNSQRLIETKEINPILIASIRFTGSYESVGETIWTLTRTCGRYIAGPPMTLHYDEEYKDGDADMEVSVPIRQRVEADGIVNRILEGGRVVSLTHHGPYETIGNSYKAIIDYGKAHGLKSIPPSREIYRKGPGMIVPGSPKRYATEIQFLIS